MKKSNIVSILVYSLYSAYGISLILNYIDYLKNPTDDIYNFRNNHLMGGIIILMGLVLIGLKIRHIRTGNGAFSFICALADAIGVYLIWWLLIIEGPSIVYWLKNFDADRFRESSMFVFCSLLPAVSCIANIISLKR